MASLPGSRLIEIRRALRLTPLQLARILNVSEDSLMLWEIDSVQAPGHIAGIYYMLDGYSMERLAGLAASLHASYYMLGAGMAYKVLARDIDQFRREKKVRHNG